LAKYFGVIKELMALRRTRVQGAIEHGTTKRNKVNEMHRTWLKGHSPRLGTTSIWTSIIEIIGISQNGLPRRMALAFNREPFINVRCLSEKIE
jgi:hypothetical protein